MTGFKLDLFLTFNEPFDDRRKISGFLCSKDKTVSLVITPAHDMEF